jgi:hypothetical protein
LSYVLEEQGLTPSILPFKYIDISYLFLFSFFKKYFLLDVVAFNLNYLGSGGGGLKFKAVWAKLVKNPI